MALYQKRVLAAGTVFDPEENGVWTFADINGDGSQDLVYIKTRNTGSGKIEVHAASNESRFQEHSVARETVFGVEDNGTWLMQDYTGDGKADLVYIKTRNTGTRVGLGYMVEVHVADAASRYQSYVQQTGTCFSCEDNGVWTMSSKGDLVFIKTRNTGSGKIEYHVASKSSNYQQFTQHAATDFAAEENGAWCLAPKRSGDFGDLYYIKTKNTGTNMVEVNAVSAGSGWKSRFISTTSSFHCEEDGQWLMAHFTHQTYPDLVYIKTRNCGSGKIEVHVVEPETSSHNMALYQQRVLAAGTVFDPEENGVWTFADINGDGSQDLVYIKTRNTGSGKIEVHAASNESRFQEHSVARETVFGVEDNGTWLMQDYTGDGKADLVYIKTRNTGTRVGLGYMVEVHVADAASRYQSYVQQTGTCFSCEDNGVWTMSSKGDLVFIKTRNTGSGKIEYHVASKSSNYQQFTQHAATDFAAEENGAWCLAPKRSGDFGDLYYIKTKNTGTNMVEVNAVSAGSGWKSRFISTTSSFHCEEDGQWLMAHFTHQTYPDLVYIKTRNCGSGKIEVHVVEPEDVTPKLFTASSQNVRLLRLAHSNTTSVLRADLQRNDGSWRDASIDLNMFLGNTDGKFTWTKKAFRDSVRQIKVRGTVVSAQLRKTDGSWASDSFDLRGALMNNDGVFQAVGVPVILAIPNGQEGTVLKQLDEALANADLKLQAVKEADGVTTFYANATSGSSEGVFVRTYTAEARASVLDVARKKGKPIEQVNVDVLTGGVGLTSGPYMGVEANVSLFKAEASLFDLNLGVGLGTGAGIKDDSLSVEAAGCGFQIGRKVSISAFGSGLEINFGRLFG